jgi:hypothetical protein
VAISVADNCWATDAVAAYEALVTTEAVAAYEALNAFVAYEALIADVAEPDKLPVIITWVDEACIGNSLPKPSLNCFNPLVMGPLSPTLISESYVVFTFCPVNEVAMINYLGQGY